MTGGYVVFGGRAGRFKTLKDKLKFIITQYNLNFDAYKLSNGTIQIIIYIDEQTKCLQELSGKFDSLYTQVQDILGPSTNIDIIYKDPNLRPFKNI